MITINDNYFLYETLWILRDIEEVKEECLEDGLKESYDEHINRIEKSKEILDRKIKNTPKHARGYLETQRKILDLKHNKLLDLKKDNDDKLKLLMAVKDDSKFNPDDPEHLEFAKSYEKHKMEKIRQNKYGVADGDELVSYIKQLIAASNDEDYDPEDDDYEDLEIIKNIENSPYYDDDEDYEYDSEDDDNDNNEYTEVTKIDNSKLNRLGSLLERVINGGKGMDIHNNQPVVNANGDNKVSIEHKADPSKQSVEDRKITSKILLAAMKNDREAANDLNKITRSNQISQRVRANMNAKLATSQGFNNTGLAIPSFRFLNS